MVLNRKGRRFYFNIRIMIHSPPSFESIADTIPAICYDKSAVQHPFKIGCTLTDYLRISIIAV